jgi:nucleobase:cation symporter-1, NCS1 family
MTVAEVREGSYGGKVVAVEPGGAEFVPEGERHGRPLSLLWTWTSPNMEFATIFVGVISVLYFEQTFGQAIAAIVVGTALGSLTHGILSSRGPRTGVPQMVLSRIAFGFRGNALPAGLNAVIAGVGWFAVNSVSGALALSVLTGMPAWLALLIIVVVQVAVAFFGHNLVHVFERCVLPLLVVAFLLATVFTFSAATPGAVAGNGGGFGGFLLTVGATFGYAAGWNPYATDYTRYLPKSTSPRATGIFAGLGIFLSCTLLEIVGAASATIATTEENPTAAFTSHLPGFVAGLTLLAIAVGAVSANVINVYSGSMSFLALGIELPLNLRRAIVAGAFGILGFCLALAGLSDAGHAYESFLLIIAYWIGPWLGVYLTDWFLRRRVPDAELAPLLYDKRYNPWGGAVAMGLGMVVSIVLFCNQSLYVGLVPAVFPGVGDLTFEVGFVLSALLYALFSRRARAALPS